MSSRSTPGDHPRSRVTASILLGLSLLAACLVGSGTEVTVNGLANQARVQPIDLLVTSAGVSPVTTVGGVPMLAPDAWMTPGTITPNRWHSCVTYPRSRWQHRSPTSALQVRSDPKLRQPGRQQFVPPRATPLQKSGARKRTTACRTVPARTSPTRRRSSWDCEARWLYWSQVHVPTCPQKGRRRLCSMSRASTTPWLCQAPQ